MTVFSHLNLMSYSTVELFVASQNVTWSLKVPISPHSLCRKPKVTCLAGGLYAAGVRNSAEWVYRNSASELNDEKTLIATSINLMHIIYNLYFQEV